MYWYVEVCTGICQKNGVCNGMYLLVPIKSMRSSCPAPLIVSTTDLHLAFNLSFVSHTTGDAPGLIRERRCSLELKHRMGLSVGRSLLPRMLSSTALPALKLAGTGSSKSPIRACLMSIQCRPLVRTAKAGARSQAIDLRNESTNTRQPSTNQQQP